MKKLYSTLLIIINLTPLFLIAQINYSSPEEQGIFGDKLDEVSKISENLVNDNKVSNITTIINRNGKIVYFQSFGKRAFESDKAIKKNDLYRIYSMTKPIVSIAIMQLYERELFKLDDPVEKFLPEFSEIKVLTDDGSLKTPKQMMTIKNLLNHTAGLSYGWTYHPVDQKYYKAGLYDSKGSDDFISRVSNLPLRFSPGEKFYYSIATDVLGVLVEKISGVPLDLYLKKHIFDPLGMVDTFFKVPVNKRDRFIPNYSYNNKIKKAEKLNNEYFSNKPSSRSYYNPEFLSGGGGLVSTAEDFMIFAESLRNDGELNGVRIINEETLNLMIKNQLPDDVEFTGSSGEPQNWYGDSIKFGLGFGIINDPEYLKSSGSKGEYFWSGAAGTFFWIDPEKEIIVVTLIQLMNNPYPIRQQIKEAVYQSLIH
tara:strand:- start:221 stop:1495 length:1275 start_codon:yes stop_codon:yes gene_type:complete